MSAFKRSDLSLIPSSIFATSRDPHSILFSNVAVFLSSLSSFTMSFMKGTGRYLCIMFSIIPPVSIARRNATAVKFLSRAHFSSSFDIGASAESKGIPSKIPSFNSLPSFPEIMKAIRVVRTISIYESCQYLRAPLFARSIPSLFNTAFRMGLYFLRVSKYFSSCPKILATGIGLFVRSPASIVPSLVTPFFIQRSKSRV
mmetsp:Transcript_11402/g.17046  ORF Transcript_11402/g.17046 Transcript_11402/m.17046 type:complete len:200 (+) Transcript_11402:481-1080(+)